MKIIDILLIVIGTFALYGFLVGHVIRTHFGKKLNTIQLSLRHKLDIISAQSAELATTKAKLAAAKAESHNHYSALKEYENEFNRQNEFLLALMEASIYGAFAVDSNMRILYFNKVFCTMWNLSEEELQVGAKAHELLKICMKKTLEPELVSLNFRKIDYSKDMIWNAQIHMLDGKICQSSSSPVRGVDGTYYGRIWELVDITERVQKEQILHDAYSTIEAKNMELKATQTKLIRQNSILTTLQEHLVGSLCVFDENKRILFFNQKFLDQWSLSREKLELNSTWEYVFGCITRSPQFLSLSDADIQHALIEEITHDQTRSLHDEIVLGDGTTLERHSTPLINQNGLYHGRVWEFIDITERVQKEQILHDAYSTIEAKNMELKTTQTELIRQNSILTTLQEHLVGALCVLDENKHVSSFNQKFLDQWSLSREVLELNPTWEYALEYIRQSPQFTSLDDADIQYALIEEIIHDQTRSLHDEIVLGDGTIIERHSTPLIDENGTYCGRIWELSNITERVQKEQILHDAYSTIEAKNMELKATQTELTRQNNILTTLQEHLAGALCVLDENKRILFFNQKFLDQWSLSREMLELNPTWEYAFGYITQSPQFLSLSDADIQHALIEEITHDQTRSLHDEIVLGDGTTLERHSTPLIYQNSVYHGRIWEFVDITERVQKE